MYFVRKTLGGEATLSNVLVMITLDVFILIVLLWMIYNATSIHMFHMYNVLWYRQWRCWMGAPDWCIVGIKSFPKQIQHEGQQPISKFLHIDNWIVCSIEIYLIPN